MKYVRTARGYQALKLEDVTVDGTPQEVSNEKADAAEKAGQEHGVEVLVFDSLEAAQEGMSTAVRLGVATPDLASGRAAVFGTGDPVESPGTAVGGEEPAQAGDQAPATSSTPAPTPPSATPRGVNPEGS